MIENYCKKEDCGRGSPAGVWNSVRGSAGEIKIRCGWWFVCPPLSLFVVLVFSVEVARAAILTLHPSGTAGDDTVDYIGGAAADALDTNDEWGSYGQSTLSINDYYLGMDDAGVSGTINSVVVRAVVSEANYPSSTSIFRIGIRTNGAEYFSSSISQSTSNFTLQSGDVYTTNPGTGSAWTWSEVNNLVVIIDHENDNQMRVTELYVEVDYTPAPATTITLSGTLYSDEGITPVSGQTVRLVVGGVSAGTDVTGTNGGYSITATINPANIWYIPLLVYVDNSTVNATTVTTMDSTIDSATISGFDLYADRLVIRQDAGSAPLDTGDMHNAKSSYSDGDILYLISWPDTLVTAGSELYIPVGHSYTPLGNVTTTHMQIDGVLNAGSNTFTVSGDWDHTNGTFEHGTSTVNFVGSGTISIDVSNWYASTKRFYNVNAAATGQITTILTGRGIYVGNVLSLGTGTLAGGSMLLGGNNTTPLVTAGATLSNLRFKYELTTTPVNITAASYPQLWLASKSSGISFYLLGDISCERLDVWGNNTGNQSILNTGGNSITCNQLMVGDPGNSDRYGRVVLNNSSMDINGVVSINSSDGEGVNEIDAGSSTINVSGNWINYDFFNAGTSTVILDGVSQVLAGSTDFYNLIKIITSADTLFFEAGSTQTVTGTATLKGVNSQYLGLRSTASPTQWNFNLAAGAAKEISYVDVQDSDASGSDSSLLEINPGYSVDSGNNVSWFGNANITVAKFSTVISDPVNGTTNPKRIPGAVIEYSILVTNDGRGQATNLTVTGDLSAESAHLSFRMDGYGTGRGIQVMSPNINGGTIVGLTNISDGDQGDYSDVDDTVTVGGIVLNEGEQAIVKFQVVVQ